MLPREKMMEHGVGRLSDEELLSLILGAGTSKESVFALSKKIAEFPQFRSCFLERKPEFWLKIPGIGRTKAARLVAGAELARRMYFFNEGNTRKIGSAIDVHLFLQDRIVSKTEESFFVICVDTKNRIVAEKEVHWGSVDFVVTDLKKIFSTVLLSGARSFIVAHNHPSGDPTPSADDHRLTEKLIVGARSLDLLLLDHVVVCSKSYYSFCEKHPEKFGS